MEKSNKIDARKVVKGSNSVAINSLTKILKTGDSGEKKTINPAFQILKEIEAAEAVGAKTQTGNTEVAKPEPTRPAEEKYEAVTEELEISTEESELEKWLTRIKNSQRLEGKHLVYLCPDIIEVLLRVRKATGIPISHLINYILLDWIGNNEENLKALFSTKIKKKILNDI